MPDTIHIDVSKDELFSWLSFRVPHFHKDLPFILAWAHKSGCTSTLKWFFWHTGDLDKALNFEEKAGLVVHNYEAKVFKARPDYRFKLADAIMQGKPIINFLRCPYERAFSSYMHLHNRHFIRLEKQNKHNIGLEVRREVQRFVYGETVSIAYPFSFWQYLNYLVNANKLEKHHSPQYTPLFDLATVRHYRLEDFDGLIDTLEKDFSLKDSRKARHHFISAHHTRKQTISRKVTLKLLHLGFPLDSSQFMVPRVNRKLLSGTKFAELIEQLFHKDIELYDAIGEPQSSSLN